MRFEGADEEFGKMPEDGGSFFITGADVLDKPENMTPKIEDIGKDDYDQEEQT